MEYLDNVADEEARKKKGENGGSVKNTYLSNRILHFIKKSKVSVSNLKEICWTNPKILKLPEGDSLVPRPEDQRDDDFCIAYASWGLVQLQMNIIRRLFEGKGGIQVPNLPVEDFVNLFTGIPGPRCISDMLTLLHNGFVAPSISHPLVLGDGARSL
ncbi:hypothetical protein MKW98_012348 [Papaver atlanticum]|uniref:Uncharacterized protein n=1 Tax=Papaver atlanticum TaxID=357466 RepID=A0AAD4T1M7_9MAGN|nr:hypothetical protein MKW98_012348 [Papaver atlanticum]